MATLGPYSTDNQYIKYKIYVTENSQNVSNNTTNVTVKVYFYRTNTGFTTYDTGTVYCKIDGRTYSASVDSGDKITENGIYLFSKTLNITHEADGKRSLPVSAWIKHNRVNSTEHGSTVVLTTIARQSSLSVDNGVLGVAQSLIVSRYLAGATHTIVAVCGNETVTICTQSDVLSITFTPPIAWAAQNTSGTVVSVKYTITTYNDGASVGSSNYTKACAIPDSIVPTLSVNISDLNGHEETYGAYVQKVSRLVVDVVATGMYGATIMGYNTVVDDKTYTTESVITSAILQSGSVPVTVTVVDSRGRTSTVTKNVLVLMYSSPSIEDFTVFRSVENGSPSSAGDFLAINFSAQISPLNNVNNAEYVLRYKRTDDQDYTEIPITDLDGDYNVYDGVFVFEADRYSTYNVTLVARDDFSSTARSGIGVSSTKLFSIYPRGQGFAFGKVAELSGVFDVGFKTKFTGGTIPVFIASGINLNAVVNPNKYIGEVDASNPYINCPFLEGRFLLDVDTFGEDDQIKQRITNLDSEESRTYERICDTTWGEWVCVSDYSGALLWSGENQMTDSASQNVSLAEPISRQKNGIILVFSFCDNGIAEDHDFISFFVHKRLVAMHPGSGYSYMLANAPTFTTVAAKYLYISDNGIVGHSSNSAEGSHSSVNYNNSKFVLRYVIGV